MKAILIAFLSTSFMMLVFFNSCKKENTVPALTNCSISEITEFTATSKTTISDDGGLEITARGFVWDSVTNPSLDNKLGFSNNGTGTGNFSNNIIDLSPNTKYYIRAYATNEIGTAYSETFSFTTNELAWNGTSCTCCETVTDIDGNIYRTVSIGSQCWLVENLKTTKYNDGNAIPNIVENNEWNNVTTAAYSWYDNNNSNKDTYGALYNYYAVETDKLCPSGWHVATDNEWKELEGYVDTQFDIGDTEWNKVALRGFNAGEKLMSRYDWLYSGNGTDDYGFEAFPNGFRNAITGEFERKNEWGTVWTDVNNTETEHYRREFSGQEEGIARFNSSPRTGYAVRCIKD